MLGAWCLVLLCAANTAAQDRSFLFSVTTTTADPSKPSIRLDSDLGAGERAFQSGTDNQPEQRVGIQATGAGGVQHEAGPAFHPSDTGRSSSALSDLPPTGKRTGYAARVGVTLRLF